MILMSFPRFLKSVVLLVLLCIPVLVSAQPRPTNVKVISEIEDGRGNIVRVVTYNEGLMKVTSTIIEPKKPKVGVVIPIRMDTARKDSISVVISKSNYMLIVKYRGKPIRIYRATFGPNPLMNKNMEGDRNTPEGIFRIANKNPASKYDKFMGINYPNDSSVARFNRLKASGVVPASAGIGGNVGIHGIWPGGDDLIKLGIGWTDGCIALMNRDIEDLFTLISVGTKVLIMK
jgi:murein L,D-transpeptidase YafK